MHTREPENAFVPAPSISSEARQYFLESFSRSARDNEQFPDPNDIAGWEARNARELVKRVEFNRELLERYGATLVPGELGGVRVVDIRPRNWQDNGKVIVYTHGGGFVGGEAGDALDSTLPIADESGLRIISVTYTLAPRANFATITDEIVAVLHGLRELGCACADIAVLGDSAGGGLAVGSVLKYRDRYGEVPGSLTVWSPWADLAGRGDTYMTLAEFEPFYTYEAFLAKTAIAYAGGEKFDHPYASPILGDFSGRFPPTLIQAGTRELLLSDSVRLYQAIRASGNEAILDLYEGMWHVFQFKPIETPEAACARSRTVEFITRNFRDGDVVAPIKSSA